MSNGKELEEMNVSHNNLAQLPQEIRSLTALTSIDLSFNFIKSLPNLSGMPSLETFIANHNKIEEFPVFSGCRRLTLLDLGHNKLCDLPMGNLNGCPLKLLFIGENNLRHLPEDVHRLKTLYNLDIHSNRIKLLPYKLALINNLTVLNTDGNPITNVDEDHLETVELTLTYLMKELMKYSRVNDENLLLKRNINLKRFLSGNEGEEEGQLVAREQSLVTIPDITFESVRAKRIRRIDFSENHISHLPSGITILKDTVEELILRENRLKTLPGTIGQLENLRYLDLSNNILDDLPENLRDVKINVLLVANNCFKHIPTLVYTLKDIRRLDFSGNKIIEIDVPHLKMLPYLKSLQLSNNLIEHIPLSLPSLTSLKRLSLSGNPIAFPDKNILDDGVEAIMTCLRKKQIEEKGDNSWIM